LEDIAITHFIKITGLKREDLERSANQAMIEWTRRSSKKWYLDISYEPLAIGFENNINA